MGGKKFLTTGLSSWSSVLMETSVLKPGTGSSMWASRCRKLQPRCDVTNLWSFFQDYRWLAFPCNPWISCLVFQTHRRLVSLQKESAGPRTQPAAAPREPAEPEQEPKPESSKKLIIFLSCSLFPTLMKLQLNAAHWEKTECFWNELAERPGSGRVSNLHTGPDVCCSGWIKCCRLMCDVCVCLLRQVSTPTDSRMNQQLDGLGFLQNLLLLPRTRGRSGCGLTEHLGRRTDCRQFPLFCHLWRCFLKRGWKAFTE